MKGRKIAYYALLALVSAQFGAVGLLKLVGFKPLYAQLAALHIAPALGLFIGACEVLGVAGLWLRRTRTPALLGLLVLAVGAIGAHFGAAVPLGNIAPAVVSVGLLSGILALGNPKAAADLMRSAEAA